jgi:hypothetical protein
MSAKPGVTLQINLAPTDLPHARHILPHQLRQWGNQVDQTLLVVDLHRSRGPYAEGWSERLPGLRRLIEECCAEHPNVRAIDVDYSAATADDLAGHFFGGRRVPEKDWNGTPFYSYFFGLWAAEHRFVLHSDSDMMYGGGSPTWVAEAIELLAARPDVLACSPFPGPPSADGRIRSQSLEPEPYSSLALRAINVSTRVFFLDRDRFHDRISVLPLTRPPRYRVLQATVDGNPPYDLVEVIISRAMRARRMVRIDFLGRPPGMWCLHPPYRSQTFYDRLPRLIEAVESGNVPEAQRGDHDVNDSMVDWTGARRPVWRRVSRHLDMMVRNVTRR